MKQKFEFLVCVLMFFFHKEYANTIDKLSSKESVQKFLLSELDSTEALFISEYADIPKLRKKLPVYRIDTIMVESPITGEKTPVATGDTVYDYGCPDVPTYTVRWIAKQIGNSPMNIIKKDIDGNGLTDLIVEAEMFFVVMDMGNDYKAYLFSMMPAISFQGLIPLPDGKPGILIKHHHVLGSYYDGSLSRTDLTFVTDTVTDYNTKPPTVQIDTLYRIDKSGSSHPDTLIRECHKIDTVVYRFGGFSKYNDQYKPIGISKIYYHYIRSSGICDHYNCIEINKNGLCYLRYSDIDTTFSDTIDSKRLVDLRNLVAYADISSMKNSYDISIDHADGGAFTVYFDDGTIKTIIFWSYAPPMPVCFISQLISSFSKTLNWQPSKTPVDFKCPPPSRYRYFEEIDYQQEYQCVW